MKRKLINIAIMTILLLSLAGGLATAVLPAPPALATDYYVVPGQSIQAAINTASEGDTIFVHNGVYNENIVVNKSLTILSVNGSASTTINGTAGGENPAVTIVASDVTFGAAGQGFSITHQWYDDSDPENPQGGIGIAVMNEGAGELTGISIQGNYIHDCGGGAAGGGGAMMMGNMAGGGSLHGNNVSGNEVFNCSMGIVLVNGNASTIYGNIVEGNTVHMAVISMGLLNFASEAESYGNVILNNEVYDSGFGIMLSGMGGDIYNNTIKYNTLRDSFSGIALGEMASFSGVSVYGNMVESNEVYNCGAGIVLSIEGSDGSVRENTVQRNTIHDMTPIDTTTGTGIVLSNSGNGDITYNTLDGNIVYSCVTGIDIRTACDGVDGDIQNNTVKGNTVYGCENGINLYENGTSGDINLNYIQHNITYDMATLTGNDNGIVIGGSGICSQTHVDGNDIGYSAQVGLLNSYAYYTYVTANAVHDNLDGISIVEYSYYIYIHGNDIMDNSDEGIHIVNSYYISISCNNIAGNSNYGVWASTGGGSGPPTADYNYWGDWDGPYSPENGFYNDGGDEALGVSISYYLSWEHTVDTAAVPAAISLADMMFYDDEETYIAYRNDFYSTGPAYTDLIVEGYHYETCCNASSAYVDLSVLLLDLLPADFETRYVSTWDEPTGDAWEDWLDYLDGIAMTYYDGLGGIWDYDLSLQELLVYGSTDLHDFFGYEGGEDDWARLIHEEMRPGDFMVPAYISTTCGVTITTFIPLTIVDYQLPLKGGWNVRSAPATLAEDWDTWGDIINTGDGLPGLEALITYNAATGLWEEPGLGGVPEPLSAYFIKMSGEDQIGFIISREDTEAPERQLYAGWNLVSSAPAADYETPTEYSPYNIPFPNMWAYDALASVEEGSGGLPGWQVAINLPEYLQYREYFYWDDINLYYNGPEKPWYDKYFWQDVWTALSDGGQWGWTDEPMLNPCGGFWLYMTNPAVLEGYSTTPYYWWPEIEWCEP